jgi:hypothetical protein
MFCASCKREVSIPLELFNGEIACPYCKRLIDSVSNVNKNDQFTITEDSEGLFNLSELYFARYLSSATDSGEKITKAEGERLINKAIEYCRQAMRMGHPKAVYRMGFYYDKDYCAADKTESERFRIAYGYYNAVCRSNARSANSEVSGYGEQEIFLIKKQAAVALLHMLIVIPSEFKNSKKYDFAINKSQLEGIYGKGLIDYDRGSGFIKDNFVQSLDKVLSSCSAKNHKPLFGVYKTDVNMLYTLFRNGADTGCDLKKYILKGIEVRVFFFSATRNQRDSVNFAGGGDRSESIAADLKQKAEDKTILNEVYLYFFNNNCDKKDNFKPNKLKSKISGNDNSFAPLSKLLERGRLKGDYPGLTFYMDDVAFKNGNIEELVNFANSQI